MSTNSSGLTDGGVDLPSAAIDREREVDIDTARIVIVYEELEVQCFTCKSSGESVLPISLVELRDKVVEGFNAVPRDFPIDRLHLELNGATPAVAIYDGHVPAPEVEQNSERAFTLSPQEVNGVYRIHYPDLLDLVREKAQEHAGLALLWVCRGHALLEFR